MKGLTLHDRNGKYGEIISDFDLSTFEYNYEKNEDRSLKFEIYRTERNKHVFDEIKVDMLVMWEGQKYSIITTEVDYGDNFMVNKIEAKHIFMESQYIYIDKDLSEEELNGDEDNKEDDKNIPDVPEDEYNSDWLQIEKGINFGFGSGGAYEDEVGVSQHNGIDINYYYEPVYSTVSGKVTIGFEDGGFGNYVWIDAGKGLEVIYAHLSEINVRNNQNIKVGQELGISGNTGMSTGPHLHYEMRQDGNAFDPMDWIYQHEGGIGNSDDVGDDVGSESGSSVMKLEDYLKFAFDVKENKRFKYKIIGTFDRYRDVGKLGDTNILEHVNKGADIFDYIYFFDNETVKIYEPSEFFVLSNEPIVYKFNNDKINVKTSITKLETYIKGYGKKKTKKETKNYNPIKTSDLKLKGKFDEKGTYSTEEKGAYYTVTLNAKWGNETLEFKMKRGKLGGNITVYIDNKKVDSFSTYSNSSKTDTIVLTNTLSKGKHTIKVKFDGGDDSVDYDGKSPVMYIGGEKSTIFNQTAKITGADIYHTYAEYQSPLYDDFTPRQAKTVYDDNAETEEELKAILKEKIHDEPDVEVSTNYIGYDTIKENSKVRLIHRPMNFNTEVNVVKLTRKHPELHEPTEIDFGNSKVNILKLQQI